MNWNLFVLALCLCEINSPSSLSSIVDATRLRENSNVLVPNNDVNLKAKIKKAFNGDVDVVELKEVNIERIKEEVKNPKIEKLIVDQLEKGSPSPSIEHENVDVEIAAANAENFTVENSTLTSTTREYNANSTTNWTQPYTSTESTHFFESTFNFTTPFNFSITTESTTTPFFNATTTT